MKKTYILFDPVSLQILAATDDISEANLVQIVSKELNNDANVYSCSYNKSGKIIVDVIQNGKYILEFKVMELPFYTKEEI